MASLDYDGAAHLLRRMGFGGPPEEIDSLASRGREGAVDFLLDYSSIDNSALDQLIAATFDFTDPEDKTKFGRNDLRRWWYTRMALTRRQFEEKMTLFWHNHFATAFSKVKDTLMYVQNLTLRQYATARFDDLLLRVSQDPAMLVWLDNITNVLGSPNENFARELQELFTCGINDVVTGQPNYTEQDVKEIARAFTGWKARKQRGGGPYQFEFYVNAAEHDNGLKTVYGQVANFSGEDIISILSARRETARYLVKKFFDFFVYPTTPASEDRNTIDKFAGVYMTKDHSIKELARAIFTSDEFFSPRARFAIVKTPAEYIVGAIRMIGGLYSPGGSDRRRQDNTIAQWSQGMGMDVMNPPDVAGWDLNLGWINTATMLNRFNYANQLATNRPRNEEAAGFHVTNERLGRYAKSSTKKTVKEFLKVLGPLKVDKKTLNALRDYLTASDQGRQIDWVVSDETIDKKIRGLVHQIMIMPEFQMA
jgi:uncharacterized protein (DUF1800 family)